MNLGSFIGFHILEWGDCMMLKYKYFDSFHPRILQLQFEIGNRQIKPHLFYLSTIGLIAIGDSVIKMIENSKMDSSDTIADTKRRFKYSYGFNQFKNIIIYQIKNQLCNFYLSFLGYYNMANVFVPFHLTRMSSSVEWFFYYSSIFFTKVFIDRILNIFKFNSKTIASVIFFKVIAKSFVFSIFTCPLDVIIAQYLGGLKFLAEYIPENITKGLCAVSPNPISMLRYIINCYGISSLYKGFAYTFGMTVLYNSIKEFFSYYQNKYEKNKNKKNI